jgi:hypothetical protein
MIFVCAYYQHFYLTDIMLLSLYLMNLVKSNIGVQLNVLETWVATKPPQYCMVQLYKPRDGKD